MSARRGERWIVAGTLTMGWYIRLRQWGCPGGLLLTWQGRVFVWQPSQFLRWDAVPLALCRRLHVAGLAVRAIALGAKRKPVGANGWETAVQVLVARNHVPRRERRRF